MASLDEIGFKTKKACWPSVCACGSILYIFIIRVHSYYLISCKDLERIHHLISSVLINRLFGHEIKERLKCNVTSLIGITLSKQTIQLWVTCLQKKRQQQRSLSGRGQQRQTGVVNASGRGLPDQSPGRSRGKGDRNGTHSCPVVQSCPCRSG